MLSSRPCALNFENTLLTDFHNHKKCKPILVLLCLSHSRLMYYFIFRLRNCDLCPQEHDKTRVLVVQALRYYRRVLARTVSILDVPS